MRLIRILIPLMGMITLFALSGCATEKHDVKAEVQEILQAKYRAEDIAMEQKNLDGVFASYSKDCVMMDSKGVTIPNGVAETRQSLGMTLQQPAVQWRRVSVISELALNNSQATAATTTVERSLQMTIIHTPERPNSVTKYQSVSRHYWVKENGTWIIKREKFVSGKRIRSH